MEGPDDMLARVLTILVVVIIVSLHGVLLAFWWLYGY